MRTQVSVWITRADVFLPRYKLHTWGLCGTWLTQTQWPPIPWALNSNSDGWGMKMGLCLCFILQHRRTTLVFMGNITIHHLGQGAWHRGVWVLQLQRFAVRLMPACHQHCMSGAGEREDIWCMDGWMDTGMYFYAIPYFHKLSNMHKHSEGIWALHLCEDGLVCCTVQLTFLLHPSFSIFIPKVGSHTLALAYLLPIATWSPPL